MQLGRDAHSPRCVASRRSAWRTSVRSRVCLPPRCHTKGVRDTRRRPGTVLSHVWGTILESFAEDSAVINPTLRTRSDDRWPHGNVGREDTCVVKNARIYLATHDGEVTKVGWGDLCLEQWHLLHELAQDGIVLVAFENRHGVPPGSHDRSEAPDATLDDVVPGLALALDRSAAVLLNRPASWGGTLGAANLPAVSRDETSGWVKRRLADLVDPSSA